MLLRPLTNVSGSPLPKLGETPLNDDLKRECGACFCGSSVESHLS